MVLLSFLPLYLILFFANLVPHKQAWYHVARFALLGGNVLLFMGGLLLVMVSIGPVTVPEMAELFENLFLPGLLLISTALLALLPLRRSIRVRLIEALQLRMEPDSAVHLVAMVFALWLVGLTGVQLFLVSDVMAEQLMSSEGVAPAMLWEQGAALVLLALLGVGLGLRRNASETAGRLGLAMPSGRQVALSLGLVLLMLGWNTIFSLLWEALAPASYTRVSTISELMLSQLMNPLGALTIGLTAGIGEELLFRGALQPRFGLLAANLLFTMSHVQYGLSPALLSVFVAGLLLGLVRQREGTVAAILTHAGFNTLLVLLSIWGWGG